ncbi:prepilin-type N-terminal cleavage/methylation domain-containing protein, partial [Candidatus Falkowbacteria bacterium]|nr:prepilin-type N-terminal cleavage/methylation domain-containing protein [Candidatus Falkowbacteria bacterium]
MFPGKARVNPVFIKLKIISMPGINKNITSGFTLIESMVAVTIFALLIVSATDIFLSIIRSQRN